MKLSEIVKDYRQKNMISLSTFSKQTGLSRGYLSMIERGVNPRSNNPICPSVETIHRLATAMGIDADALLRMMGPDEKIAITWENNEKGKGAVLRDSGDLYHDHTEAKLLNAYHNADEITKKHVRMLLDIPDE